MKKLPSCQIALGEIRTQSHGRKVKVLTIFSAYTPTYLYKCRSRWDGAFVAMNIRRWPECCFSPARALTWPPPPADVTGVEIYRRHSTQYGNNVLTLENIWMNSEIKKNERTSINSAKEVERPQTSDAVGYVVAQVWNISDEQTSCHRWKLAMVLHMKSTIKSSYPWF